MGENELSSSSTYISFIGIRTLFDQEGGGGGGGGRGGCGRGGGMLNCAIMERQKS